MRTGFFSKVIDTDEHSIYEDDFNYERFNKLFIETFKDKIKNRENYFDKMSFMSFYKQETVFSQSDLEIVRDAFYENIFKEKIDAFVSHKNYKLLHSPVQMLFNYLNYNHETSSTSKYIYRFLEAVMFDKLKAKFLVRVENRRVFSHDFFWSWYNNLDFYYEEKFNDIHRQCKFKRDVLQNVLSIVDYNLSYDVKKVREKYMMNYKYSMASIIKYLESAEKYLRRLRRRLYHKKDVSTESINKAKNRILVLQNRKLISDKNSKSYSIIYNDDKINI